MTCIFCKIIKKEADASIVYEDEQCIAFMDIAPVNTGQCLVIPKDHIDHFTDIPDEIAMHIMQVCQSIGRKMLSVLNPKPLRIGYVVHGFGVFHAHMVIVPQHGEDDITSIKMMEVKDNKVHPNFGLLHVRERAELDELAEILKKE